MDDTTNTDHSLVVIVPTTGLGDLVRGALDALKVQTCRDFDVVVVVNGTDEDIPWWMGEEFPFAAVERIAGRAGFAAAVNLAVRTTTHPLVMLLNDDARPAPDCIAHLLDAANRNEGFDGFATRICFYYSPSVLESAGDGFSLAGRGFHRGWRQPDGPPYDRETEVFGACAAGALYRRRLFDQAGLFEEDFFAVHEDVDLAFRARRKGLRFLYVPAARVLHKGSITLGRKSDESVYLDSRNSELVLLKNVPFGAFLSMLPWYLLYTYHALICALRYGRLTAYLRGKFAVLRAAGRMLRKGTLIELEATTDFAAVAAHFDRPWHREGLRRVVGDRRSLAIAVGFPLLLLAFLVWYVLS